MLVDLLYVPARNWLLSFTGWILILIIIFSDHLVACLLNEFVVLVLHGGVEALVGEAGSISGRGARWLIHRPAL